MNNAVFHRILLNPLNDFRFPGYYMLEENMPTPSKSGSRCDTAGRAFAGSQRRVQFYVNEQPFLLQDALTKALQHDVRVRWVSPLKSERYKEYWDDAFLSALGLSKYRHELRQFWPTGGPHWDALGAVCNGDGGVLLLESKSHMAEIRGNGCGATAEASVRKIDSALAKTKRWLEVDSEVDWKRDFYQSANRLAHLYFFREVLHVPAFLVNVYFIDDPHSPTSRRAWNPALREVKGSMGLKKVPFYADVFLPALAG